MGINPYRPSTKMYVIKLKSTREVEGICIDQAALLYVMERSKMLATDAEVHVLAEKVANLSKEEGYVTMQNITKLF